MRQGLAWVLLAPLAACSQAPDKAAEDRVSKSQVVAEARKLKFEPGEWETTTIITAIDVTGVPASATKAATDTPTVTRNCITPAQAAKPDANILSGTREGNCTYQRFSMDGARIDAAMTCAPAGMPGSSALTLAGGYSATAFDMGMTMKTDLPGSLAMNMKATVKGRRVGACAAGGEAAQ